MSAKAIFTVFLIAFVASHFLLSHPLRAPLVARLGEAKFRGLYSLVALLTFLPALYFYGQAGRQAPLWQGGDAVEIVATVLMWVASVLLVGSFFGNPALPGMGKPKGGPRGVFTITRHPMMWSFAIWGAVHMALIATPKAIVLDSAIILLALAGAAGQDRKKAALHGANWHEWTARTAFVPFTRGMGNPGALALVGGTLLFLVATWLHPVSVGIWRWLG